MSHLLDPGSRRFARSLLSTAALLACAPGARAQQQPDKPVPAPAQSSANVVAQAAPQQLPAVQIQGNYINSVGSSDAASAGSGIQLVPRSAFAIGWTGDF